MNKLKIYLMNLAIAIVLISLLFFAIWLRRESQVDSEYTIKLLDVKSGCRLYRFRDNKEFHYWTICDETHNSSVSK